MSYNTPGQRGGSSDAYEGGGPPTNIHVNVSGGGGGGGGGTSSSEAFGFIGGGSMKDWLTIAITVIVGMNVLGGGMNWPGGQGNVGPFGAFGTLFNGSMKWMGWILATPGALGFVTFMAAWRKIDPKGQEKFFYKLGAKTGSGFECAFRNLRSGLLGGSEWHSMQREAAEEFLKNVKSENGGKSLSKAARKAVGELHESLNSIAGSIGSDDLQKLLDTKNADEFFKQLKEVSGAGDDLQNLQKLMDNVLADEEGAEAVFKLSKRAMAKGCMAKAKVRTNGLTSMLDESPADFMRKLSKDVALLDDIKMLRVMEKFAQSADDGLDAVSKNARNQLVELDDLAGRNKNTTKVWKKLINGGIDEFGGLKLSKTASSVADEAVTAARGTLDDFLNKFSTSVMDDTFKGLKGNTKALKAALGGVDNLKPTSLFASPAQSTALKRGLSKSLDGMQTAGKGFLKLLKGLGKSVK